MRSIHSMLPLFLLASAVATVAVASGSTSRVAQLEEELSPEFFLGPNVNVCPDGYDREPVSGVSVGDKKRCWATSSDPKAKVADSYVYVRKVDHCPEGYRGLPPPGKGYELERKALEMDQAIVKQKIVELESLNRVKKQAGGGGGTDKTNDKSKTANTPTKEEGTGGNSQLGDSTNAGNSTNAGSPLAAHGAVPLMFVVTAVGSSVLLL